MLNFNGYNIPAEVQTAITAFIEDGITGDDFVHAVLSNDLLCAVKCATPAQLQSIADTVEWLDTFAPIQCWGNEAKVLRWAEQHPKRPKDIA